MIKLNYKRKRSDSQQVNPVLASFDQNFPNEDLLKELDFKMYQHSEPRKQKQTILSSSNHEKFEYQGKGLDKVQGTKYLVGVMGSKDQMNLYDIDHIYSLQQVLKSDKELGVIDSNIGKQNLNVWEQKQKLATNMGTLKAKRKVQQQINNMIVEDKISSKEQMSEMLKAKSSQLQEEIDDKIKLIEKQEQDSKREFLPEFDLLATDPSQVYQMNSIISGEEFESIQCDQFVVALKNKTRGKDSSSLDALIKSFNEYPKHLLNTYETWNSQILKYKPSTSYTLKYIIYLNYLMKFAPKKQFTKTTIEEVAKDMKIDLIFAKSILSKYYQGTPCGENKMLYVRNDLLKDKLICHILVLNLFIHGFKFDGAYLSLVLKVDQKKIIQYAKECGCSVSLKENSNRNAKTAHCIIMTLTTPFKLQANKKPMKDKK